MFGGGRGDRCKLQVAQSGMRIGVPSISVGRRILFVGLVRGGVGGARDERWRGMQMQAA